ncbi:MAG TPA: Hsp70 family protein [Sporichthya sp.]|nr:Hsp70 family protein [Sporichthya sp.]
MQYRLGIDLGTTFTAAAVLRDGASPEPVPLGKHTLAAPSVMYLDHDGCLLFGDTAEDRAPDAPERVARHFKLRVGDEVPLMLGRSTEVHITGHAHDLAAAMIAWVVHTVAGREGAQPAAIAITHPASWNRRQLGLLRGALNARHLGPITLVTEPEAAAIGYAHTGRLIPYPATLGVYDLGGGTLDVAVLDTTADGRFTRRGTPQSLGGLGGIDFDDAILGHLLIAVDAASWAGVDADRMDPEILRALARLRAASVAAKETLSTETTTAVSLSVDGTAITVPLPRADFDDLIEAMVRKSIHFFHEVIADAGLGVEDLSCVLLTGGSVQVPLVTDMLSQDLPAHVRILRAVDPKAMVAAGAVLSLQTPVTDPAAIPAARTAHADVAVAQARGSFASSSVPAPDPPPAAPGAPVLDAADPAPVRPPRPVAPAAPPKGNAFLDDPAFDGDSPKRRRRMATIGAVVVLGVGIGTGAALWMNTDTPDTQTPSTVVTPSPAPETPRAAVPPWATVPPTPTVPPRAARNIPFGP